MSHTLQTVPLALLTPGELRECDVFILHPNQENAYQVVRYYKLPTNTFKMKRDSRFYYSNKVAHYIHVLRPCGERMWVRLWKEDKPILGLLYCSACTNRFYTKSETRNVKNHDQVIKKELNRCRHCSGNTQYDYSFSDPKNATFDSSHYPSPWNRIDDNVRNPHPWVSELPARNLSIVEGEGSLTNEKPIPPNLRIVNNE